MHFFLLLCGARRSKLFKNRYQVLVRTYNYLRFFQQQIFFSRLRLQTPGMDPMYPSHPFPFLFHLGDQYCPFLRVKDESIEEVRKFFHFTQVTSHFLQPQRT